MFRMIAAACAAVAAAGLIACGDGLTDEDVDATVEARIAEALPPTAAHTPTPAPTATPMPTAAPTPTPAPTATPMPTATHTPPPTPTATPMPTGRIVFASVLVEDENWGIYVMDEDGSDVERLTSDARLSNLPSWSPDGRRIAFSSNRDGNSEIYVTNEDGLGVTRLTNHPALDANPSWSPDGRRIAFISDRGGNLGIYVMDVDGSDVTRLTNDTAPDSLPSWSPDGRRIAFASAPGGDLGIYVMNADGSDVTRITNHPALDGNPSWSPDGRRIAFVSDRDGNGEIYVMNADGSDVTRLTNNTAWDLLPSWSPDSRRIAFSSLDPEDGGSSGIYVVNADGSGLTRLRNSTGFEVVVSWLPQSANMSVLPIAFPMPTATPVPTATPMPTAAPTPPPTPTATPMPTGRIVFASGLLEDENWGIYVMDEDGSGVDRLMNAATLDSIGSWSPDGRRIAFSSDRDGNSEIYVTNEDGLGVTRLTNNTALDGNPSWSPDGRRIAFVSDRDENFGIYVMGVDGSDVVRLTNDATLDSIPSWSPDGRRIAFVSDQDGNTEIYVINADGSDVTRITNNAAGDVNSSWSPDGRRIAFVSDRDGNYEIYVMNADGSDVTRLTNSTAWDLGPSWSLDSRRIAFSSLDLEGGDSSGIYVVNADGSGLTRLRNSTAVEIVLSWVPQAANMSVLPIAFPTPTAPPVPTATSMPTATPTPTSLRLDKVRERGYLICASNNALPGFGALDSNGNNVGFDIDLCRAVAVAVLGDPDAVEFRQTTAAERGPTMQSGEVDIMSRNSTWTSSRDAQWGNFAQTMFYGGSGFMVRKDSSISDLMDLTNAKVCVQQGTTTELNLEDFNDRNNMNIDVVVFPDNTVTSAVYQSGQCDALTTDRSWLVSTRASFPNPDDHVILPGTISEEPLGPVVPHGDEQWYDIVKTVMAILIYAEAYGITSDTVPTSPTGDWEMDGFFGLERSFGQEGMGLKDTVAQDVIRAVGNYGEIYDRHLTPQGLIRDGSRNALWSAAPCTDCPKGGQIYAAPLRGGSWSTPGVRLADGAGVTRLDRVRQRGRLICASNNALLGFGALDGNGNNVGFEIDLCRAVAAAVLGDPDAVEFRPITPAEKGATMQSGEVDIMSRNTTWTSSRDVYWGNFARTMFYDGQSFMVRKDSSISDLMELADARVCVQQGTTTELNLEDFNNRNNLNIDMLVFPDYTTTREAYQRGQCDALTTDRSGLAVSRASFPNPDDHVVLPGTISEEPLGPMVPHGDEQWYDIVKTVMAILIYAEAYGITSDNVPTAAAQNWNVDRLLGLEWSFGQRGMGLKRTVAQDVIRAVGNYGEIYDRHLTPLGLIRDGSRNALWSAAPCTDCPKGGQIYAAPLR